MHEESASGCYLLPDRAESAGLARTHVRAFLLARRATHLTDDATLLVSELVTNALLHAPGKPELRLHLGESALRIEVVDGGSGVPHRMHPTADRASGRGLILVEAIASAWGVTHTADTKSVWCELPLAAAQRSSIC